MITESHGVHAAREMLGHADISTTVQHYVETKGWATVGLGPLLKAPDNVVPFDTPAELKRKKL